MLANSQSDPYLSQAVLDLQFGHSQRVGYDVATNVLNQLQGIGHCTSVARNMRAWACCVRRIFRQFWWRPALSATTPKSACWEATAIQQQIAEAIYNGLRKYFDAHPLQSAPSGGAGLVANASLPGGMTATN